MTNELIINKPDDMHLHLREGEILEFVLKDSELIAEETLFVDDSLTNIKSAENAGMNTFHIKNYNIKSIL